jgi:hypothetical protein
MCFEFLEFELFVASQENDKNILKMTKLTKAPKVKKYFKDTKYIRIIIPTFVFNLIIDLSLICISSPNEATPGLSGF